MKVVIDTWGWLTLRDRKESRHQAVKDFYRQFRDQNGIIYTSDYVIDETITLIFKRLPFKTAKESLSKIDKAIVQVRHLSVQRSLWNDVLKEISLSVRIRRAHSPLGYVVGSYGNSDQSCQTRCFSLDLLNLIAIVCLTCEPSPVNASPLPEV